jgi:transcriptional regulator with XRE-family HTH domain
MPLLLRTGRQLAAARALAGLTREELADAAGIASGTIKRLEGSGEVQAQARTIDALEKALEDHGVELLGGDQPGVRMRKVVA